jgi:hypothetical protein
MNTVDVGQIIDVFFTIALSCPTPASSSITFLLAIASIAVSLTTVDAIVMKYNHGTFADIVQNNCTITSRRILLTIIKNYLNHLMSSLDVRLHMADIDIERNLCWKRSWGLLLGINYANCGQPNFLSHGDTGYLVDSRCYFEAASRVYDQRLIGAGSVPRSADTFFR